MSFTIYDKTKGSRKEKMIWFAQQDSKKWKNIDKKRNEIQENFSKINKKVANNQVMNNQVANNQVANNQVANNQVDNNQVANNQVDNNNQIVNTKSISEPDNSGWD